MRRVFLRSPSDPLVKTLLSDVKEKREGFLHILKHNGRGTPVEYSVIFAPIAGQGGSVPARRFTDVEELTGFLSDDIGVRRSALEEALDEVKRSDSTSIYPVTLTARQMKRLGLS